MRFSPDQRRLDVADMTLDQRSVFLWQGVELIAHFLELLVGHVVKVDESGTCALNSAQQLVELQLHQFRTSVLSVLDEEHHEEGDDRRARIDHQLPAV